MFLGCNGVSGEDCYSSCRGTYPLPNPRWVSLNVAKENDRKDSRLSQMAVFFGQFIDHDITLSPEHHATGGSCCDKDANDLTKDSECMEIELPKDDPFYSKWDQTCLHLTRSVPHCSKGLGIDREQKNVITSFLDASNVYGSDDQRAERLREKFSVKKKIGRLSVHNEKPGYELLPEENHQGCPVPIAGDARAMENPSLASLHTLFHREHNRIVKELSKHRDWKKYGKKNCKNGRCDNWMYQNARRILIAEWQNIIYAEWLPLIVGAEFIKKFDLKVDVKPTYKSTSDPSIIASFSTAAFRFGHTMVNGEMMKKDTKTGNTLRKLSLSDTMFSVNEYKKDGVEQLLAGLDEEKAQSRDQFVSSELTTMLFKNANPDNKAKFGEDLVARNIARGRDHGIPSFADFYSKYGPETDRNRRMNCWSEKPKIFSQSSWEKLKEIYVHPNDIDLFIGGLLENTDGGGVLGYMFSWIVSEQFRRLKEGDRFFFTHPGKYIKIKQKIYSFCNISNQSLTLLQHFYSCIS